MFSVPKVRSVTNSMMEVSAVVAASLLKTQAPSEM